MSRAIGYVTWGSVRGLGPVRKAEAEAMRDLSDDREDCHAAHGYSDRAIYWIDEEGYARDDRAYVWPRGRANPALSVPVATSWRVSIKVAPHEQWTCPSGWGPYTDHAEAEAALAKAEALWMAARLVEIVEVRS